MRTNSAENEQKLFLTADSQGGYFTAKQAGSAGYYNRLRHYHVEKGHWLSVDRGIYRLRNYPSFEREDLIRWSLWSVNREGNPQIAFSHHTAMAFHQLGDIMPAKIHFIAPPGFRKKISGGCVVHRAKLSPEEMERHEGFFVTTPFRTLFDAYIYGFEPDQLQKSVLDAYKRGFIPGFKIKSAKTAGGSSPPPPGMTDFISYLEGVIAVYRNDAAHGKK
ncbi:MAG: hypothetical protein COT17_03090 [Elusimicrobia bacterium CG08_land_8_20_14_0_20_51_18]|nr:MAG: hypothetical protein COT17_03090 [Elusimicrobia bacterium CG08_land_8_20_14_0_20_51_18]